MTCNSCATLSAPNRLKLIRFMLKLSQRKYCGLLGVSTATLQKMENRVLVLKEKQKEKLSSVGISVQWIDYGIGQPFAVSAEKTLLNIKKN